MRDIRCMLTPMLGRLLCEKSKKPFYILLFMSLVRDIEVKLNDLKGPQVFFFFFSPSTITPKITKNDFRRSIDLFYILIFFRAHVRRFHKILRHTYSIVRFVT